MGNIELNAKLSDLGWKAETRFCDAIHRDTTLIRRKNDVCGYWSTFIDETTIKGIEYVIKEIEGLAPWNKKKPVAI